MKENSREEIAKVDEDRAIREIKRELADEDRKEYMSRWFAKDLEILIYYIEKLQKENENFEKLNKDYSYSVDIVRENTRLRRQVFDLELENEELKGQYAEYVKLTCNEVAKNSELNSESNSAIKEKNKIINAMSKYIAKLDIDEDICKKMGIFQDCEIKDVENCKKCIIEYFKNKMRQKCDTATTEK